MRRLHAEPPTGYHPKELTAHPSLGGSALPRSFDTGIATDPLVESHKANPKVPCSRNDDLVSRVGVEVARKRSSLGGDVR